MPLRSCQAWNDQTDIEEASSLQPLTHWPWTAVCQLLPSSHLTATPVHLCSLSNPWKPPVDRPLPCKSPLIYYHWQTGTTLTSSQYVGSPQSLRLLYHALDFLLHQTDFLFHLLSQPTFTACCPFSYLFQTQLMLSTLSFSSAPQADGTGFP